MSSLRLGRDALTEERKSKFDRMKNAPVTVLQIGEGNFLRGFTDWMLHVSREQGLFHGSVAVTQPRPSGKPKIEQLNAQDGLYTLVVRGLEGGEEVERSNVISVFSQVFDPYENWNRLIEIAQSEDLRFVISNTTEAGLTYKPEPLTNEPIISFPGKIAYLLYRRYEAFGGAADKGLLFLPCELLERNGDTLLELVLRYSSDWGLPEAYRDWVLASNRFLNTLVDRIVTGYPEEAQADAWFSEWGYSDPMLTTAEPYHLWAIEGEAELDDLLPLKKADLNVQWTDDLSPFQQRKVRILNAAHTWMAPLGLLHGIEQVREFMEHPSLGQSIKSLILHDVVPALPYPQREMTDYANTVFERFANPYIRHRLADIAMNSLSKFKARLLPSLRYYANLGQPIPERLAVGLAGLLRYTRVRRIGDGYGGIDLQGKAYSVRDDEELLGLCSEIWQNAEQTQEKLLETVKRLLSEETVWDMDLSAWDGLAEAIITRRELWEEGDSR
ncbi:tagaturonate reductase [Cohnella endophytica]|uniref:Tagaturonate reductase n=1 Tax=Cohnella endophytica TaxID=2419778 RepID=A0A494Y3M0_9BACL|nr:tagaturonate reductase [Cohnella endophytica]RKP57346.1 tagaturonate reductase [Cohnella endophytica]